MHLHIHTYVMHMCVQMYTLGWCNDGGTYTQYTMTIGNIVTSIVIIMYIMPGFNCPVLIKL